MTSTDTSRPTITAGWLVDRVAGRSSRELGAGIENLIRSGTVAAGAQLPTIREVARAAEISPGTVLIAWNHLRGQGLIQTHRRGGTTVVDPAAAAPADAAVPTWATIDFLQCAPDISLQPDLRDALLDSLGDSSLNVFGREYMTERLRAAVAPTWPFAAEAWTTAGGGTEALLLAVAAAAEPGDLVAVHEPATPGVLDTLRDLGLTPVGVQADASGPMVASVQQALEQGAVSFVFQPGAEFAVHGRVTQTRADELAAAIRDNGRPVWVIEDDAVGPLASHPSPSMGQMLPDMVVRVRSYCKAYGIDVRTSVIGGSRELVERSISLRSHGVGSNSRILQNALAHLVGSAAIDASVAKARAVYRRRRDALVSALELRGIRTSTADDGLVVWVEVGNELDALMTLANKGIAVAPGSRAFVTAPDHALVRISPLQLPDDTGLVAQLAAEVATAASGNQRQFFD